MGGGKTPKTKNTEIFEIKTGSFIWSNGSKYSGEYREVDGTIVRHGTGSYYCSSTLTTFNGQWDTDKMNGKGKIEYPSGQSYDGEWKDNFYNGKGVYQWADSTKLSGEFFDNAIIGPSVFENEREGQRWTGDITKGQSATLALNLV